MKPLRKHLKLIVLFLAITLCLTSCTQDSDEEVELLYETRCFVVKDRNTNTPIVGASVGLLGPRTLSFQRIGNGITDHNGEICIELKGESYNSHGIQINCAKDGYRTVLISYSPPVNFFEIYLVPK